MAHSVHNDLTCTALVVKKKSGVYLSFCLFLAACPFGVSSHCNALSLDFIDLAKLAYLVEQAQETLLLI